MEGYKYLSFYLAQLCHDFVEKYNGLYQKDKITANNIPKRETRAKIADVLEEYYKNNSTSEPFAPKNKRKTEGTKDPYSESGLQKFLSDLFNWSNKKQLSVENDTDVLTTHLSLNYVDYVHFFTYNTNTDIEEILDFCAKVKDMLDKKTTSYQYNFYHQLFSRLGNEITAKSKNLINYLKDRYKISDSEHLVKFLTIHPSILLSIFDKSGRKPEVINEQESLIAKFLTKPESERKILLCHSLSLYPETIFLYGSIGRFARTARILKVTEKTVFLTDEDFAIFNRSIQKFKEKLTEKEVRIILGRQLDFRKELYKFMSFDTVLCGSKNLTENRIDANINQMAEDYANALQKEVLKEDKGSVAYFEASYRLDQEAAQKIQNSINNYITHNNDGLNKYPTFKKDVGKRFKIAELVSTKLRGVSIETFKYFFLQYFNQQLFEKHLKIAEVAEKHFDTTFYDLQKFGENQMGYELPECFYFNNYYHNSKLVVPYYFPSGDFMEYETFEHANKNIILINDDITKIKEVLETSVMKPKELAALVSDLLSFAHFFSENYADKQSYFEQLNPIIENINEELYKSWVVYTQSDIVFDDQLQHFKDSLLSKFAERAELPYWYFPYLMFDGVRSPNIEPLAQLIAFINREVPRQLGFGTNFISPWII